MKNKPAAPKTTHTPGPWHMAGFGEVKAGNPIYSDCHPGDKGIGESFPVAKVSSANRDSDARLIAAAPDLLAALKALVSAPVVSGMGAAIRDDARQNGRQDEYEIARAAIKRAEEGK